MKFFLDLNLRETFLSSFVLIITLCSIVFYSAPSVRHSTILGIIIQGWFIRIKAFSRFGYEERGVERPKSYSKMFKDFSNKVEEFDKNIFFSFYFLNRLFSQCLPVYFPCMAHNSSFLLSWLPCRLPSCLNNLSCSEFIPGYSTVFHLCSVEHPFCFGVVWSRCMSILVLKTIKDY